VIELRQLTKRFGDIEVVRELSFSIEPGTVLGFLGPNGAGKSTTMKMITGFLEPTSGSVEVYGHDVLTNRRAAQSLLGYLPEGAPCYEDMSVKRFLSFMAEMRGFSGADRDSRVAEVIGQLSMNDVARQRIETL
jgi:ABC-2 type transport system ATP-binding protein